MNLNSDAHRANYMEAAQAAFDLLTPAQQQRSRTLGALDNYYGTPKDKLLDLGFDGLIENATAELFGRAGKRRALFIIGGSGSGKSTAIEKHIAKRPQFQPRVTAEGETVYPLVYFEAPKPLTMKGLPRAGLKALGYPINTNRLTEAELFDLWKDQIRAKRCIFLVIDEMQNVFKDKSSVKEAQTIADVLKSMLQIPGWPLHIVLSGVPELADFLQTGGITARQLKERSRIVELRPVSFPDDVELMRKIMVKIVENEAGLVTGDILDDIFMHRLIHSREGAFGSVIQAIRGACETALRTGHCEVTNLHFATSYALESGCRPAQNIFLAADWMNIVPGNALSELAAEARGGTTEAVSKTRKRR